MKKLLTLALLFFSFSFYAQNEIKVTSKKCLPKKGYHLRLKSVFDDSRCPEGVNCIWAGEVSIVVEVYKDKKFVEEQKLTLNSKNREENLQWFSKYFSKKLQSVELLPYPRQGKIIKFKSHYLSAIFAN